MKEISENSLHSPKDLSLETPGQPICETPEDIDQLLTIDFTKPEGSEKRYSVTIVPKVLEDLPKLSSDLEHIVFLHEETVGSGLLSEDEWRPVLQSTDSRSGYAATPEEAATVALANWIKSQHLHASDGIDLHLQ